MLRSHTLLTLIFSTLLATSAFAEHHHYRHHHNDSENSGQRITDYKIARPLMWGTVYATGGNTLYCGLRFGARKGSKINIEHVFPMSWVAWHFKCGKRNECRRSSDDFNLVEADLHNLWPALVEINEARRSHPFAIIKGEKYLRRGCDFELDKARKVVEPRAQVRGEIARSMFYMANEYGLKIRPRLARTLKRWHYDDPVSEVEKRRNNVIEQIQGNRNPFIDNPQLMDTQQF